MITKKAALNLLVFSPLFKIMATGMVRTAIVFNKRVSKSIIILHMFHQTIPDASGKKEAFRRYFSSHKTSIRKRVCIHIVNTAIGKKCLRVEWRIRSHIVGRYKKKRIFHGDLVKLW